MRRIWPIYADEILVSTTRKSSVFIGSIGLIGLIGVAPRT